MLILTRRTGQTIVIGNDIKVTVTEVNGNHVRLGIDAPKDVIVNRQEVHDRIQTEMMQDKVIV
ncbi:MAG: carbon storage regulator CsrA [Thiotrichaceae bacterium]|nr:carbon storage regulator CsrA [Thiotrichaceae bacterium]